MCSMREVYRDEFFEEGFEEGRKEIMFEVALRMLKKNAAVEFVAECTTLPVEEVLRLKAANGLA